MTGQAIIFKTARFNLSVPKDHFINPCCFGEDLAVWLQHKLAEQGIEAHDPGQEDWGWYTGVAIGEAGYFIAIGGNSEEESQRHDYGEWQIVVEKRRSLWQRLKGSNKITADDPVVQVLLAILNGEPDFSEVRCE